MVEVSAALSPQILLRLDIGALHCVAHRLPQYIPKNQEAAEMDAKALLPIVASVALVLALQAGVMYLWVDMAEKSIETPLKQLLLTRSLRANHVLNTTLQPVSLAQEVLGKCASLCAVDA